VNGVEPDQTGNVQLDTAPTNHASADTIFGIGNNTNYGHVRISDLYNSSHSSSTGYAASPFAVKKAYDLAAAALPATGTAKDSAKLGGKTWDERLLDVYPVGSIYMSVNSSSPASLFGGTWEQLKDRFMLGAGDTYAAGSTGGAGNHTHNLSNGFAQLAANGNEIYWDYKTASFKANWSAGVTSGAPADKVMADAVSLGGQTDGASNIPPYLAVYMWKRVS
jgi:hypothetical protein